MTALRCDLRQAPLWRMVAVWLVSIMAATAGLPEWRSQQDFEVASNGLVKVSLPVETLNAARPDLDDLRVWDDSGELAYWIERPAPAVNSVERPVKAFNVKLNPNNTVVTIDTGAERPVDNILLQTPAPGFVKAARIEGSTDGSTWQEVAAGVPFFRQWHGVDQLRLPLPARAWLRLRLTIDDRRSEPIPFTGASIHLLLSEPAPTESQPVTITERNENPGQTRLTLDLGAANLSVASVEFVAGDPLFARNVLLAAPKVTEAAVVEQTVGRGSIYRVALEGQPAASGLAVPVEAVLPTRELVALIDNLDSPPLTITGAIILRRPVYLVFMARKAGTHHLFMGNSRCAAPRYDLASLSASLKAAPLGNATFGPVKGNPDYHAPEALPGIDLTGAPWDPSGWACREVINLKTGDAHEVELTAPVLAHAAPSLADLRVARGSNQIPYLLERTSISRAIGLDVTPTNDPANRSVSRWALRLPESGLPLTSIGCAAKSPLFQRQVTLYEEVQDQQGSQYRRVLGQAAWTRAPEQQPGRFVVSLNEVPQGSLLFLETDNGDNPPLELQRFDGYYPATRILFKAKPDERLYLYYGKPNASAPQYDLNLVAGQLIAADRASATLGPEERLKAPPSSAPSASGGFLFWGVLSLVVIALLAIVARLLPKAPPPQPASP